VETGFHRADIGADDLRNLLQCETFIFEETTASCCKGGRAARAVAMATEISGEG